MRWLVFFALLITPAGAVPPAEPCPSVSAGWTIPFSGPITSVQYDQDAKMLYVIFNATTASAFVNVPIGVMQGFQNTPNPLSLYNTIVAPSYHALFLFQTNNCPLQFENGSYLWTD